MKKTDDTFDDVRVAEDAARWFAKLQGESATAADWLAFERWLQSAPLHAKAYERLEGLWIDLEYSPIAKDLGGRPLVAARRRARSARRVSLNRRAWLGGGAVLAASVGAAIGLGVWTSGGVAQTYETHAGQIRDVALADGTHIRLNESSKIVVRLGRDARRVQVADAEAVFDVAHDARRPFLITVADRQIRVVGTEFNLRHRADLLDLTVRRGVVEVRSAATLDAAPTRVAVGQELIHTAGQSASLLKVSDPDQIFAWTNGQLIYRDQSLSDVAADLSRRFATPVRAADAKTAAMHFTGVLVTDNEMEVLRRLEAYAPVRVERTSNEIILHHR